MKPNCYECKYRRGLIGSAHSACYHPEVEVEASDPLLRIGGITKAVPQGIIYSMMHRLGVDANSHGVANGWFVWPWNFDPVWLTMCNGFTPKEDNSAN